MIEAPVISPEEEKKLLDEWFATVQFDEEDEGIPELAPENDDEEPESRSQPVVKIPTLSDVDFEELMTELRKRDPDNPF